MNDKNNLSQYVTIDAPFRFEAYVMNYLRALAQQPIYGGEHPLNTQLHLLVSEAHILLRNQQEISKLEKLLNCKNEEVFERLRDLLDEWDGVRIPDSFEAADLLESDGETLLLSDDAHQIASRYLKCSPEGVLGTLFDPWQIYNDLISVSGGARFANNDSYKLLRYLATEPNLRQKIKSNLDLRDWWEVLENWVKPSIRADLVSTLSQESDHTISKAFVLRELFRKVKISLGAGASQSKYTRYINSTRLGVILPDETSKFWQTLRDFSTEDSGTLKLDGLSDESIAKNSIEASAKEALNIAENYLQSYIQPIQHELGQVDMLGMIALRHRFQGIIDELLSNALHYASLDSDVQNPFSYIQDAIRYYCHGEYKIALSDLLNVPFLSLEQMGIEYKLTNPNLEVEKETAFALFSSEDNTFLNLGILKQTSHPPRNVKNDELIITLQIENHSIEILCLNKLEKFQIDQLKTAFPKTTAGLINNSYPLAERIVKTPIAVSTERQKINDALRDQIEILVQSLVLSGTTFSLGRLISSPDVFNKIPRPVLNDTTLVQTHTLEKLGLEIISVYKTEGVQVTRVMGT